MRVFFPWIKACCLTVAMLLCGCVSGEVWSVDMDTGERTPYQGPFLELNCPDAWEPEVSMTVPVQPGDNVTHYTLTAWDVIEAGITERRYCCFHDWEIPPKHGGFGPCLYVPPTGISRLDVEISCCIP